MTFDKIFGIMRKQNPDIEYDRLKSLADAFFYAGYDVGNFVGDVDRTDDFEGRYSIYERLETYEDDDGKIVWYNDKGVVIKSEAYCDDEFVAGYDGDELYPVEGMEPYYIEVDPEWKFDFNCGEKVISDYKYEDDPANNTATVTINGKKYTLSERSDVNIYVSEDGEKVKEASLFYHNNWYNSDVKFRMGFIKC